MDHARLAATFRKLALDAGREIMEVYGRPDFDVAAKADASPVTEADLRADRVICEGLGAAFPSPTG